MVMDTYTQNQDPHTQICTHRRPLGQAAVDGVDEGVGVLKREGQGRFELQDVLVHPVDLRDDGSHDVNLRAMPSIHTVWHQCIYTQTTTHHTTHGYRRWTVNQTWMCTPQSRARRSTWAAASGAGVLRSLCDSDKRGG